MKMLLVLAVHWELKTGPQFVRTRPLEVQVGTTTGMLYEVTPLTAPLTMPTAKLLEDASE
jgi:hypothetical protein